MKLDSSDLWDNIENNAKIVQSLKIHNQQVLVATYNYFDPHIFCFIIPVLTQNVLMQIYTAPKFQGNCDVTNNIKKLMSDRDVKNMISRCKHFYLNRK